MEISYTDSHKKSKILIIGATGFIGFAVTKRLIEMGFENVCCLYRNEKK